MGNPTVLSLKSKTISSHRPRPLWSQDSYPQEATLSLQSTTTALIPKRLVSEIVVSPEKTTKGSNPCPAALFRVAPLPQGALPCRPIGHVASVKVALRLCFDDMALHVHSTGRLWCGERVEKWSSLSSSLRSFVLSFRPEWVVRWRARWGHRWGLAGEPLLRAVSYTNPGTNVGLHCIIYSDLLCLINSKRTKVKSYGNFNSTAQNVSLLFCGFGFCAVLNINQRSF